MSQTPADGRTNILLEAGTNEVEILVFRLGERSFGVNVAKVREVIPSVPIINVPHGHDSVVGLVDIRESILTLIDLAGHLGIRPVGHTGHPPAAGAGGGAGPAGRAEATARDDADRNAAIPDDALDYRERSIVVTEFNGQRMGFLVDAVDRIHRVGWDRIKPIPRTSLDGADADADAGERGVTNGVMMLEDTLVLLVDFESVADSVLADDRLQITNVSNHLAVNRDDMVVVLAEDSAFMRSAMRTALESSGYRQVHVARDGCMAWELIDRLGADIDVIVSDIEMPGMDGLALTRRIREDSRTADVPVVLFSSLVSEDNAKKGQSVGATLQIRKPELPELVRMVDHLAAGLPYTPPAGTLVHGPAGGDDRIRRAA